MNRAERRRAIKQDSKVKVDIYTKQYSYTECYQIADRAVEDLKTYAKDKYDELYHNFTCAMACTLNAPPMNFGKKRVADFMKLFFDQLEGLKYGTIDRSLMIETAEKVGVKFETQSGNFVIDIDSSTRENNITPERKVI